MIFSKLAPELFPSIRPSVEYLAEEVPVPIPSTDSEYDKQVSVVACKILYFLLSRLELRCVIAVMRHGDRTPKQKMKMVVTHKRLVAWITTDTTMEVPYSA